MNDTSNFNVKSDDESEISLADIVEFIKESWKQLVLAGIVGAALGFGGWYFLGSYKAELTLLNNTNTNMNRLVLVFVLFTMTVFLVLP